MSLPLFTFCPVALGCSYKTGVIALLTLVSALVPLYLGTNSIRSYDQNRKNLLRPCLQLPNFFFHPTPQKKSSVKQSHSFLESSYKEQQRLSCIAKEGGLKQDQGPIILLLFNLFQVHKAHRNIRATILTVEDHSLFLIKK